MTPVTNDVARWKPHRAGIRNIWEYDEQELAFADGRMILRGPNGSGKSNALALIFPFLFDGTMSAAAMDPFAGGRSMKSLLLGVLRDDARSGFRHEQRLGYVWLEFTRPGPDGDEHVTIGCGARARAEVDARSWFFLTRRRVGVDLDLAPGGTPLTRGRLIEELGAAAVQDKAEDHRQVVARDLLGMSADQLGKLNGLIRALRRPQLAGKLDLDELSAVLSNGLPAVAASTLDDIAASLDDLERIQLELAGVRDALATVDAFLPTYLTYLRGEARLRAGSVLHLDSQLSSERRELRRCEQRHEELTARGSGLRSERTSEETRRATAAAEREALKDSKRYKGAEELEREEALALALEAAARAAGVRVRDAEGDADDRESRAQSTEQQARSLGIEADRLLRDATDRADVVRATWSLDVDAQLDPVLLRAAVDVMVSERRTAIVEVRSAIHTFDLSVQKHGDAEEARSRADGAVDDAAGQVRDAVAERDRQRAELAAEVTTWLTGVPGLDGDQAATLAALVDLVADGDSVALEERYRVATEAYRDSLRDERIRLRRDIADQEQRRNQVHEERELVAAEHDPGPSAPAWRAADRTRRAGAPLWACCDFTSSSGLDEGDRAGLEVGLEAAGLLDAWVAPDEAVDIELDAWLRPEVLPAPDGGGSTLISVLEAVVPEGSGLSVARIEAALGSIALGRVGVAVDADGRFSLGPLVGRAAKPAPEFIGATARAARRVRRLAELDALLVDIAGDLSLLTDELDEVDAALVTWEEAAGRAPDTGALVDAVRAVRDAERGERDARDRAREAAAAEAGAAAAVGQAEVDRDAAAGRLRVPTDAAAIDRFAKLVDDLGDVGREALTGRRQAIERLALASDQRDDAGKARARAILLAEESVGADREAKTQRKRVDTLHSILGDDVRSVFAEVASLDERIGELDLSIRSLGTNIEANQTDVGEAIGAITAARGRIDDAEERLRAAEARLPVLRGQDVLALLEVPATEVPLEWVAFARWISEHLPEASGGPPHDQVKRAVDRAQRQLLDDLHHGYAPAIVHDNDVILIEVTSDDRSVFGLAELRDRLQRQVTSMEQHLTDSDREIFERHLLNRVSHELRRLLGEADDFRNGVNRALGQAATASGLKVELEWVPAGDDPETRAAVALLRRDTDQMGDDDRAALRRFFDLAIRRQRAEEPDAGYRGNLEKVVDYRQWHRFQPFLVGPDGRAKLTRERFKGLSGGEQAVALHLPLFAAAAAHYDRADPTAPRLVALDEAFAGIDEAMRGELLGLTVAFRLDVLLTGHELWGAYAEVPAIAVHDLLRHPPLEGVSVLTLHWDGHGLSNAGEQ